MYKKVRMLFGLTLVIMLTACNAKGNDSTDNARITEIQTAESAEVSTELPTVEPTEEPTGAPTELPTEKPTEELLSDTIDAQINPFPVKRVVGEDTSEVGSHETENTNYALYPSTIVETDPKDKPSQFAIWEKTIEITFPQIYYSNEYGDYHGSEIETAINHDLFLQSIGYDDSFLFGRDARLLRGCTVDYEITKADDALISVKYMEECWNVFHGHSFCWGITIDTRTGEKAALSEFITLEDNLVEQVENGEIQYISSWFEWEYVIDSVEEFYEYYQKGLEDAYSCYYLEEDAINLVIDLMRGNSAYIILRIPLE